MPGIWIFMTVLALVIGAFGLYIAHKHQKQS